jgi:hypothetical protein
MRGEVNEEFFVSVLNPSRFDAYKYSYYGDYPSGYAFGLLDKQRKEIRYDLLRRARA